MTIQNPALLNYQPPAWVDGALCAQIGMADDWFPDVRANANDIKAVCRRCPVATQCLTYALDNNEEYGIWGGTTPADRDAMRPLGGVA